MARVQRERVRPFDPYCRRFPADIPEYELAAADEGSTPDDFVRFQEGTYNPVTGHFACTDCYLAMGSPAGAGGWVAP